MIEIIPNWHPIFVHFSIGLLFTSVILFFGSIFLSDQSSLRGHLQLVARYNLWIGYAAALVTAFFGWLAYNSVAHDTPSHEAMTLHRNWALITLAVFLPVVLWSVFLFKQIKNGSWFFIMFLSIAALFLARTGWLGSEAVYRYGLGVMSLPQSEGDGHSHEHGEAIEGAQSEALESMGNHVDSNIDLPTEHQHSHDQSAIEVENIDLEPKIKSEEEEIVQEPVIQNTDNHSGHQH